MKRNEMKWNEQQDKRTVAKLRTTGKDRKPGHTKCTSPGNRVNTQRNTAGTLRLRDDFRLSSKAEIIAVTPSGPEPVFCIYYITLVLPGKFYGLLPIRYTLMPGIHDSTADNIAAGWTRNVTMLLLSLFSHINSCRELHQ